MADEVESFKVFESLDSGVFFTIETENDDDVVNSSSKKKHSLRGRCLSTLPLTRLSSDSGLGDVILEVIYDDDDEEEENNNNDDDDDTSRIISDANTVALNRPVDEVVVSVEESMMEVVEDDDDDTTIDLSPDDDDDDDDDQVTNVLAASMLPSSTTIEVDVHVEPEICSLNSSNDPSCRICLESGEVESLITPCLCRGSAALCHVSCLQTWLRTKASMDNAVEDIGKCGVCRGDFMVTITHERIGKRITDRKDIFKLVIWLYCLSFVVFAPLFIFRNVVDYLQSRSAYMLTVVILNCLGFILYLYFTIYAINAWVVPAFERWYNSNQKLVVKPAAGSISTAPAADDATVEAAAAAAHGENKIV